MGRFGAVLAAAFACALLAACGAPVASPIPGSTPSASPSPSPSPSASVSASASATPAGTEGIDITTLTGPTCPVQREGQTCTRPLAAIVVVTRADGSTAETVHTSANGTARVALPPGTYTLSGQLPPGGGPFPRPPAPTKATVRPGSFVSVQIIFDTGIR
jgi:hypothetical protein